MRLPATSGTPLESRTATSAAGLQTTLFRRTTRSLAPTDAARHYYDRCARALALLADGERDLEGSSTAASGGRVRISAPTTYGHFRLLPSLGAFAERYPNVRVDVSPRRNRRLSPEGRLDGTSVPPRCCSARERSGCATYTPKRAPKSRHAALEARGVAPIALPTPAEVANRALGLKRLFEGNPIEVREALRRYFVDGRIVVTPSPRATTWRRAGSSRRSRLPTDPRNDEAPYSGASSRELQ